jgi:acetylglutamate kinase
LNDLLLAPSLVPLPVTIPWGVPPLKEAIEKADVLIEALQWIRAFRDKVTVVKIGGRVIDDEEALRRLLLDVVFMETVGMRPVIVHGGGAAINRRMQEAGLEPRFIQGRRYTDDATLGIVEQVLAYDNNNAIADRIEELGGRAAPLNFKTTNVLFGRRLNLPGEGGKDAGGKDEGGHDAGGHDIAPIDLGHVGEVTRVDRTTIDNLCYAGIVPVIPSMCIEEGPRDPSSPAAASSRAAANSAAGQKLNVNADTAAMAVAEAIHAEKLVFLSDVNGVRRRKDDPDSLIHSLNAASAGDLIASGAIESGMIPKVQACLETLDRGVRKVHIIDGRIKHSLLLEVYTSQGVGTEIVK